MCRNPFGRGLEPQPGIRARSANPSYLGKVQRREVLDFGNDEPVFRVQRIGSLAEEKSDQLIDEHKRRSQDSPGIPSCQPTSEITSRLAPRRERLPPECSPPGRRLRALRYRSSGDERERMDMLARTAWAKSRCGGPQLAIGQIGCDCGTEWRENRSPPRMRLPPGSAAFSFELRATSCTAG